MCQTCIIGRPARLVLTAVPEPGTWLMLMCVLAFGLLARRR